MTVETDAADGPQVDADSAQSKDKQPPKHAPKKFRVTVYDAWCKQCGICVEFCPKGVLTKDELGTPQPTYQEKCIGCTQCVLHCPDFAITVIEEGAQEREK